MNKNNEKTLENNLREIEKEINEMEKIDGIKQLVNKYTSLSNNVDNCKNKLNELMINMKKIDYVEEGSESENEIVESSDEKNNGDYCDHEIFIKNSLELEQLKQKINGNIDNIDLEELMEIFNRASKLIYKCNNYLRQQKMEIINVN